MTHLIYCADIDADLEDELVHYVDCDLNSRHFTISDSEAEKDCFG